MSKNYILFRLPAKYLIEIYPIKIKIKNMLFDRTPAATASAPPLGIDSNQPLLLVRADGIK
jgi:hypothetical protein